jgi:hypothetical protein
MGLVRRRALLESLKEMTPMKLQAVLGMATAATLGFAQS